MITGNSNIVKLPTKEFDQTEIICKILNKILFKKKYKKIKKNLKIVRYSSNEKFTNMVSSIADGRLIWGGDRTIETIKKCNTKNKVTDLIFGDRVSLSVIDLKHLKKINKLELKKLINNFYNDTFLVDQNACSSPHLIVWYGKQQAKARSKFWNCLYSFAINKYDYPESASIDKFTQLCKNIVDLKNIKSEERFGGIIFTVLLNKLDKNLHHLRGKWGFFYEYFSKNLDEIKNSVNNKYQTLTYFGINKKTLKDFVITNNLNGIDRIVPIGQSLDISLYWDGYDINKTLSRIVDIK